MRVSYRWLLHTLGFELPLQQVLERLTMAGLEVEGVVDLGAQSGKVITARILEMRPHPNAENLTLCEVDAGGEQPLRIVCGAKNMKPGDLVPLAIEGATLPNGITIKKSKIRGEESQGMMCSPRELGWNEDAEGLLILAQDHSVYKVGQSFDALIDIKVTPNRPDCLSVYGIARDLAVATGHPVPAYPTSDINENGDVLTTSVKVRLDAPEECPRYCGRVIRDVKVAASPLWLKLAVESAGLRSINNVVDVTNYILLELGHPLHAFDLDKIAGGEVVIRRADEGEVVTTLDGQESKLTATDLLIADPEKPIALAGIMGCGNTEISEGTRNVFLECAYFRPQTVRNTSKRLGKSTDSSYRFERGTDWQSLDKIIDRAAKLIAETAGGTIARGRFDEKGELPQLAKVEASAERISRLLGMDVSTEQVRTSLSGLGFGVEGDGENLLVTVPAFRPDVAVEADLVEEVGRMVGYDKIPTELPKIALRAAPRDPEREVTAIIRRVMQSDGFSEVTNYSFTSQEYLARCGYEEEQLVLLKNPLSAEYAAMRPGLLPSILETVLYNQNHGTPEVRLFEIGKVFRKSADGKSGEHLQFVAAIAGAVHDATWRKPAGGADFFDVKGVAEDVLTAVGFGAVEAVRADGESRLHPGKSATLRANGKALITIGELHPKLRSQLAIKRNVMVLYGDIDALKQGVSAAAEYEDIPQFPSVTRDIALVADREVASADIEAAIAKRAKSLLARIQLFDVYEGERIAEGKKSLAYALEFNAKDRTLKDEEINQLQQKILADLKAKLGVEIRA